MAETVRSRRAIAYRPPEDTGAYIEQLVKDTGLSANQVVESLVSYAMEQLASADVKIVVKPTVEVARS